MGGVWEKVGIRVGESVKILEWFWGWVIGSFVRKGGIRVGGKVKFRD